MNGYQQHGPCVYRAESDGTLTRIGMATDLRRHIRNASRRLNDTGDLDLIVGELARWARVRLFFVDGPISLSGGGEAGGNWIRQGVVRSGGGSGGRRYFCRQRPMGDFRWSSRAS